MPALDEQLGFVPDAAPAESLGFVPDHQPDLGFVPDKAHDLGFVPDLPEKENYQLLAPPAREPAMVKQDGQSFVGEVPPELQPKPQPVSQTAALDPDMQARVDRITGAVIPPQPKPPVGALLTPIPQQPTAAQQTARAVSTGAGYDYLTKPLWDYLPQGLRNQLDVGQFADQVARKNPDDAFMQNVDGIINGLGSFGKSMTTPAMISMMGTGELPSAAQKLIAAGFAVQMASATPELARQLGTEMGKPDDQQDKALIANLFTQGAINTGFAAFAGAHAIKPGVSMGPDFRGMTPEQKAAYGGEQTVRMLQGKNLLPEPPGRPAPDLGSADEFLGQVQTKDLNTNPQPAAPAAPPQSPPPVPATPTPPEPALGTPERVQTITQKFLDELKANMTANQVKPPETPAPAEIPPVSAEKPAEAKPGEAPPPAQDPMQPGERLVTIQRADGTTYPAAFSDKFYEHPARGQVPSIARLNERGQWSHGMLGADETLLDNAKTETQPASEQLPEVITEGDEDAQHLVPVNHQDAVKLFNSGEPVYYQGADPGDMNLVTGKNLGHELEQGGVYAVLRKPGKNAESLEAPGAVPPTVKGEGTQPTATPQTVAPKPGARNGFYENEEQNGPANPLPNTGRVGDVQRGPVETPARAQGGSEPVKTEVSPDVNKTGTSQAEPPPIPGIIKGSSLESWADNVIASSRARVSTGIDPTLIGAYAVKGAALIESGVRQVAAWTKQMMADHGLTREQAMRIWVASRTLLDRGRQTDVRRVVNMTTGLSPEESTKPMSQADVAGIQERAAKTAFRAGVKTGAESEASKPEKVTLKQGINQLAETQTPIERGRTQAQAIQEKLSDSMTHSQALREYFAGQEKASAIGAKSATEDLKQADKWSAADAENIRKSLLELVNTLPVSERGRFTQAITAAMRRPPLLSPDSDGMYERAATVAARIMDRAETVHREGIISDIKKTVERATDSPSVDVQYKQKILQAVRRVGLRGLSGERESLLKSTRDYVARMGDQSTVPDEIVRQIDLLSKTPVRDLPTNVLESIQDRVHLLEKLGRTLHGTREQLYLNERAALEKDIQNSPSTAMDDAPEKRSPGIKLPLGQRISQSLGNRWRGAVDYARRTGRALLVRDVMFDMMDHDANYKGALNRIFGGRIDADYNSEMNLRSSLHEPFKAVTQKYGAYSKLEMERISIYAISKEDAGIQRLKDSGVLPSTIRDVSKNLTEKERAFYAAARSLFDTTVFPQLKKFMRDNYNVDVVGVKNYWPFQRDHSLVEADKSHALPIDEKKGEGVGFDEMAAPRQLMEDFAPRRTTKAEQGMTIERIPEARGAVKLDAGRVVNRHLNDFAHLISTQRNLKMLGQVARAPWFAEKYGTLGRDYTLNLLDSIARNSSPIGSTRTSWIDTLTKNTSAGIIGLRLLSQMKHAPNVAFSLKNVRPDYLVRGLVDSMTPQGRAFIQKNFAEIFNRFGGEPAIEDLVSGVGVRKVQGAAFFLERALDSVNARSTVMGRYMQEMANRGVDPASIYEAPVDKEAQRMALLISRQSVTSPLLKDTPQAISRGQLTGQNMSFARALFQFQNTMLRQAAFMRHDIWDLGLRQLAPKQFAGASLAFLAMLAAETTIVQANKRLLGAALPPTKPGHKPAEEESLGHGMVIEGLKRVPFAGNVVSMSEYGETGVPIADTVVHGVKSIGQLATDKNDFGKPLTGKSAQRDKVDAATFAAEVAGIPGASTAGQIIKNKVIAAEPKQKKKSL